MSVDLRQNHTLDHRPSTTDPTATVSNIVQRVGPGGDAGSPDDTGRSTTPAMVRKVKEVSSKLCAERPDIVKCREDDLPKKRREDSPERASSGRPRPQTEPARRQSGPEQQFLVDSRAQGNHHWAPAPASLTECQEPGPPKHQGRAGSSLPEQHRVEHGLRPASRRSTCPRLGPFFRRSRHTRTHAGAQQKADP